jgi:hypothetical protein
MDGAEGFSWKGRVAMGKQVPDLKAWTSRRVWVEEFEEQDGVGGERVRVGGGRADDRPELLPVAREDRPALHACVEEERGREGREREGEGGREGARLVSWRWSSVQTRRG